jgi:hypothetical protein
MNIRDGRNTVEALQELFEQRYGKYKPTDREQAREERKKEVKG